ncbi:MAG: hypothetical protein HYW22_01775 [Candidatus Aenigmarchaeota archaeon]|nr:hypothetical protein [Candidatus Aenigmarchaeota archaeon]
MSIQRTNGRMVEVHNQFLQEQLMEAQQSLFYARSVREAKFLQTKIDFLQQRLKEAKSNGRKK